MRRIRALIVEDEPPSREMLERLLGRREDVELITSCGDGPAAVEAIRETKPDVVFLDIELPEMSGMQVIDAIGAEKMPAVVFVTAYDHFAVEAFERAAIDYLLKPYTDERLDTAMERVRSRLETPDTTSQGDRLVDLAERWKYGRECDDDHYLRRVLVRDGRQRLMVDLDQVEYMQSEDHYVRLHVRGRSYLLLDSLSNLEQQLDSREFVRIHRQTIVRAASVRKIEPGASGTYEVTVADGTTLTVSRTRRGALGPLLSRLGRA